MNYTTIQGISLTGTNGAFILIINAILGLIGVIAVLFIIIGGVRYVTASGNPDQMQSAKNSILYGVIGLIAAILAYAIVNYVITSLIK